MEVATYSSGSTHSKTAVFGTEVLIQRLNPKLQDRVSTSTRIIYQYILVKFGGRNYIRAAESDHMHAAAVLWWALLLLALLLITVRGCAQGTGIVHAQTAVAGYVYNCCLLYASWILGCVAVT